MVRDTERKLVFRLFAFEFFQGAALALYFTAAITLFLTHIGAEGLPKVYILAAFLLWATGLTYSFLEHRMSTAGLVTAVLLFNTVCIFLFRLMDFGMEAGWFFYIFLAGFNVFYLLYNLEFWGMTALLFDVRQSKRLFAIVSSGDMPAKLLGYVMALVFTATGTVNLLWVATGCLLIALVIFWSLKRADPALSHPPESHHHYASQSLQSIRAAVTGNALIRRVAVVSFLNYCFYVLASFMLYGFVKTKFHSDLSLAKFFAVFYGTSQCLTMIVKAFFTGRVLDTLGLRKSLLISPLILLGLSGLAYFLGSGHSDQMVFYLILVLAVSVDLLRSVFQMPLLLATLQPLPVRQRLRGHTIIKGLMDPFAYLFSGVLLLVISNRNISLNFSVICAILILITVVWTLTTFTLDHSYIRMLTAAIRKRTLSERDISLTDADSVNFLLDRLQNGSREEAEAVLNLVSGQPLNHEKLYLGALHHKEPQVRHLALRLIGSQNYQGTLPHLQRILGEGPDPLDLPHLIRTMAALDGNMDASGYLDSLDPAVAGAAAMTMLRHEDTGKRDRAESFLTSLLESGEQKSQYLALEMIGEMSAVQFSEKALLLYESPDPHIRREALLTTGRLGEPVTTARLLQIYLDCERVSDAREALCLKPESTLRAITPLLELGQCSASQRRRLYSLLGHLPGQAPIELLQTALQTNPQDESRLIAILFQMHFRAGTHSATYQILIEDSLQKSAYHVFRLHFLEQEAGEFGLLKRALELELADEKEKLIHLFSFLYDPEKIRKVKSGFDLNTKESLANAFELLGMAVPRSYSDPFVDIFEPSGLQEKCHRMVRHYRAHTITMDHLIREILVSGSAGFSAWTKSSLIYGLGPKADNKYKIMVAQYAASEDPILKDTAAFVVNGK